MLDLARPKGLNRKMREFAGDISICLGFKPGPRHVELDPLLSENPHELSLQMLKNLKASSYKCESYGKPFDSKGNSL
jgi:hypothetical protein